MFVLLALLTAACSATSSALGIKLKQIGSLAAVVTGVQLPLTLLSGILLPLSLGPAWLRVLGHLNPMYYTVQAARDLAAGTITTTAVGIGFLVTAAGGSGALVGNPQLPQGHGVTHRPAASPYHLINRPSRQARSKHYAKEGTGTPVGGSP